MQGLMLIVTTVLFLFPVTSLSATALADTAPDGMKNEEEKQMYEKLTPILLVEEIEGSFPFWKKLGFECTVQVPHEDRIGFAIMVNGAVEVMLQTFSSALADVPEAVSSREPGATALYIQVTDLDAIEERIEAVEIVIPRRTTDYGATELFVRAPSGHVIGFAMHGE